MKLFINIYIYNHFISIKLHPTEVYYNLYINNGKPLECGCFFVGNGNIFIKGETYILHGENDKIKLQIIFINPSYTNNIDYIMSDSYEVVENKYYDTIEDAININEMIKIWCHYKDYKCNKKFIKQSIFKTPEGNLLNKIQYRTFSLVDHIIYNKMLKIENNDMEYVPNSYYLHEKINYIYNKKIFNLDEF